METITLDKLREFEGKEIGVSAWRTVTQAQIDAFAETTDDFQFVHVDPERALREAPFGGTIAHGFLTLSLLSAFLNEVVPKIEGGGVGVNQGFDRIRFVTPVKSGARIRGRFVLAAIKVRPSGWIELAQDVTVEIEGSVKPALVARWLTLTYSEPKNA